MNATAIRAGFLTSVQDLGRTGLREFGISLGGALDPHALRVANLLVGNAESDAGLEITFGGLRLRFADERIVAWCGGDFAARIGSVPLLDVAPGLPFPVESTFQLSSAVAQAICGPGSVESEDDQFVTAKKFRSARIQPAPLV
jgi:allophanate hydrolase subunit 2